MPAIFVLTRCILDGKQQDYPINIEVDVSFLHEACKGAIVFGGDTFSGITIVSYCLLMLLVLF